MSTPAPPRQMNTDLAELRELVATMAEKAETRVEAAVDAWLNRDADLADSLRYADDEVDQLDVDIETACTALLENGRPTGAELRYIIGTIRLDTQLERIADLARSIAKRVLKQHANGTSIHYPGAARQMAARVVTMIGRTREAIIAEDADIAREIRRLDPELDELNREVYIWAAEHLKGATDGAVEGYLDALVLVRALERIGDLCSNAAEDVIFIVGGSIVRHTPL